MQPVSVGTDDQGTNLSKDQPLLVDTSKGQNPPTRGAMVFDHETHERIITGWCWYDWADSPAVVVFSYFIPKLVEDIATDGLGCGPGTSCDGLGIQLWGYLYAGSTILALICYITFCAALERTIGGRSLKKPTLKAAAYISSVALICFIFVVQTEPLIGIILASVLFVIAKVGNRIAGLSYDSILDCIAIPKTRTHEISAEGFIWGYWGMGFYFAPVGALMMAFKATGTYGHTAKYTIYIFLGGLWWFFFSYFFAFPMMNFEEASYIKLGGDPIEIEPETGRVRWKEGDGTVSLLSICFKDGLKETSATVKQMLPYYDLRWFLISWMFLSDAASTAQAFAPQYATKVLKLSMNKQLIVAFVLTFGCFLGVKLFSGLLKHGILGAKAVLVINFSLLALVALITMIATELYMLMIAAFCAGLNWGSMNTFSRSVVAQIVPYNKQAPFFALYELTQKGTAWLGPLTVALLTYMFGEQHFKYTVIFTVMTEAAIGMPIFLTQFDLSRAIRQRLAEENKWKINYNEGFGGGQSICCLCNLTENEGKFDESMGDDQLGDNKPWRYKQVPEKEQIEPGDGVDGTLVLCDAVLEVDAQESFLVGRYELVRETFYDPKMEGENPTEMDKSSWRTLPDSNYDERLNRQVSSGNKLLSDAALVYRNMVDDATYLVKDKEDTWAFVWQNEDAKTPGELEVKFAVTGKWELKTLRRGGSIDGEWTDWKNENPDINNPDIGNVLRIKVGTGRVVKSFPNFAFVDLSPGVDAATTRGCTRRDTSQYLVVNRDLHDKSGKNPKLPE